MRRPLRLDYDAEITELGPRTVHASILDADGLVIVEEPGPDATWQDLDRIVEIINRESVALEALVRAEIAVARLKVALAFIASGAPTEEPEYGDWGGDTERAETWGGEQEHWRLAQIARTALAVVEGAAR
jgi:hypothetical protein